MDDGILPVRRRVGRRRLRYFPVCRERGDLATEMLDVEFEGLTAVAAVIEVGVELHSLSHAVQGIWRTAPNRDERSERTVQITTAVALDSDTSKRVLGTRPHPFEDELVVTPRRRNILLADSRGLRRPESRNLVAEEIDQT